MTALISKLKKYEAVKFLIWRIAVNGNSMSVPSINFLRLLRYRLDKIL